MASMIYISGYQRNFGRQSDDPAMAQSYESQYQALLKSAVTEEVRKKYESAGWTSESVSPVSTPTRGQYMPHASLKLVPGVDENRTPTLNEAAISYSQLIRFIPDRAGYGLVQKYGGWKKFYPNKIGSPVRALWAWEDTNTQSWLGVGAESLLGVINNNNLQNITPTIVNSSSVTVDVSTTSGSNVVTIKQVGSNITSFDTVFIKTQISVGGLVLFGNYPCITVSADTYQIKAVDLFGNPLYATSTVADGGAVASYATTNGSSTVTVTLNNHGYSVGSTYPVLVSTTVGGITINGNYLVSSVIDANTFTILAAGIATSTTTGSENGGNAAYLYYIGVGPLPAGSGYGVGGYGVGGYGSGVAPTANPGTPITTTDWTLDNYGNLLIAVPLNGSIYYWNPIAQTTVATVIPNAPQVNAGAFVAMPQQQIVAWGSTQNGIQDPLLLRWTDVGNFNTWIGTATNQAGFYRIPKGSKIVQCIQGPQQGYIWTDLGMWSMQYIGGELVYGFNEVGNGCGLIGRRAAGSVNGTAYWMGQSQFYTYGNNSGVSPITCPVWDVIFQDLDTSNLDKIRFAANSRFGEVAWFYPIKGNGGEITNYVKYNYILNCWDYGTLQRTAWINQSVFGPPIGADANGYIYQHETGTDADTQPMVSSFQTGYFALQEGEFLSFIDQVWPDMKWGYFNTPSDGGASYQNPTANIQLTFYVTNYPGDTPTAYGPFSLTQATEYITPRFRGRLVSIQIQSSDIGSFWRIGNIRYRFQPDGKF